MINSSPRNLLVIAPSIPRPDAHSGDLRLFTMLEIMAKEWRVFLMASSNPGDEQYISRLERHGVVVYRNPLTLSEKLLQSETFQLALIEFYHTAEHLLERIRILQPKCRVVVDSVDAHFLRLGLKYGLTRAEVDLRRWRSTQEKELAVYAKADAIITVTADDAVAIRGAGVATDCHVIPNVHEPCPSTVPPEPDSLIFVGGFAHEPNVDAVQFLCGEILPRVRAARPRARLTIVGSNPPEVVRRLASEAVTVTGFVPETSPYLHKSQVSVAPLRYGAGMKGKVGEAMAHGVPVVTTSVGAQGIGLIDRKNALIADSAETFAAAVLELLTDAALHQLIRSNAIDLIKNNYTRGCVGKKLLNTLDTISSQPAKQMKVSEKLLFSYRYLMARARTGLLIRNMTTHGTD